MTYASRFFWDVAQVLGEALEALVFAGCDRGDYTSAD